MYFLLACADFRVLTVAEMCRQDANSLNRKRHVKRCASSFWHQQGGVWPLAVSRVPRLLLARCRRPRAGLRRVPALLVMFLAGQAAIISATQPLRGQLLSTARRSLQQAAGKAAQGGRALQQSQQLQRSTAEKEAHAAQVRSMKPELLLKNLRVKEQDSTDFVPEACAGNDNTAKTTCAVLQKPCSCTCTPCSAGGVIAGANALSAAHDLQR